MCSVTPITKGELIALSALIIGGSVVVYAGAIFMLVWVSLS
jgi:hypothetical protein